MSFLVFVIPVFSIEFHTPLYTYSFVAIFFAAVFCTERHRRPLFVFAVIAVILKVVTGWIMIETLNQITQVVIVIFFIVIFQLLSHIVRQQRITPRVILEAINGYLLLGLGFSVLVGLAMRIGEQAFSFPAEAGGVIIHHDFIYFAFVTMSTLGYGEIVSLTPTAKSLSILMSVTGQLYLAVLIALLAGKYVAFWLARENSHSK